MKKRLNQYSGRLSAAQIAEGINLARRNASRLAADSASLLDAGRLPSATALAVLAIEEAGKCSILREIALARDERELPEAWRSYRSHTTKNRTWLFVELFLREGGNSTTSPRFSPQPLIIRIFWIRLSRSPSIPIVSEMPTGRILRMLSTPVGASHWCLRRASLVKAITSHREKSSCGFSMSALSGDLIQNVWRRA